MKKMTKTNQQPVQAVFFDIDGTLIDFQTHKISPSTKWAICALHEAGIPVAVASTRSFSSLYDVEGLMDLPWDGYVTGAGVCVRNREKQIIHDQRLSAETIQEIADIAAHHQIPLYVSGSSRLITDCSEKTLSVMDLFDLYPVIYKDYEKEEAEGLTLIGPSRFLLKSLFYRFSTCDFIRSKADCVDIVPKGTSKATGIHILMKSWNLPEHAYACFGDSAGDHAMLLDAAASVAMPWASSSTQKKAQTVCENFGENTLYFALKKLSLY